MVRNLEEGISETAAEFMLREDLEEMIHEASFALQQMTSYRGHGLEWPFQATLSRYREGLQNMIYNLGVPRFMKFKKMINAICEADYDKAADEASRQQVGHTGRVPEQSGSLS